MRGVSSINILGGRPKSAPAPKNVDNRESDKIELLKSNKSEDVMMQAVNLNDESTGDAV